MFFRFNSGIRSFFKIHTQHFRNRFNHNHWSLARRISLPLLASCAYMPASVHLQDDEKQSKMLPKPSPQEEGDESKLIAKPQSLLSRLWSIFIHLVRFCQLMVIFTPTILLSPLLLFKRTEGYWMDVFVKAIERSGVVFIKAFQYLSHRRDMIGPELAAKF